mmetsp:Transcript_9658/g.28553  ORF Transcript_9658/g.28553 Transcript_9658/m.28553 type:complete len:428 (+) Transcript_9658:1038-2321(+)
MRPTYRITGLELVMHLYWERTQATDAERDTVLHIFVEAEDSWHCVGSDVHYSLFPREANASALGPGAPFASEFHDRYKCGINVRFEYGGNISVIDVFAIITSVTNLAVLLTISQTLVAMLAFSVLGYTSQVYKNVAKREASVNSVHARIATQAVVAAQAFGSLKSPATSRVTRARLADAFSKGALSDVEAAKLAAHIMLHAGADEEGGLTFQMFVDMFSAGESDFRAVCDNLEHPLEVLEFVTAVTERASDQSDAGGDRRPGHHSELSSRRRSQGGLAHADEAEVRLPPRVAPGDVVSFIGPDDRQHQVSVPHGAEPGTVLRFSMHIARPARDVPSISSHPSFSSKTDWPPQHRRGERSWAGGSVSGETGGHNASVHRWGDPLPWTRGAGRLQGGGSRGDGPATTRRQMLRGAAGGADVRSDHRSMV